MEKELCVRCNNPTPYDTSITYYDATLVCRGSGADVCGVLEEIVANERRDKRWQGIQDLNQIR